MLNQTKRSKFDRRQFQHLLAGLMLSFGLAPSVSAQNFELPKGCVGVLSVQSKSCTAEVQYTCEKDTKGDKRIAYFDAKGLRFQQHINAETHWLDGFDPILGSQTILRADQGDLNSVSTLLATGSDVFDFTIVEFIDGKSREIHVSGKDQLLNKTVVIDEQVLERITYSQTFTDATGAPVYFSFGEQLFSRKFNAFFHNHWKHGFGDDQPEFNETPVEFILPGEPGFLSTQPKYDCEQNLARRYPKAMNISESSHDKI